MHPRHSPQETYRRVDFDARVAGADPRQLVALCYEQLIAALGSAIYAAESADNALKSASLTRALAALTALQLGISPEQALAPALTRLYTAARRELLDSAVTFDAARVGKVRDDFRDISAALIAGQDR